MLKLSKQQKEMWEAKPLRGARYTFVQETGGDDEEQQTAVAVNGAGVPKKSYNATHPIAAEWGYSFTHLNGSLDGMNRKIQAWYPTPPKTRQEALQVIHDFLMRQYIQDRPHPWVSLNGHYPWHHYAGEFGFDILGSEIGENINNYQWHIALNRGAAKQYQKPWSIDFSAWRGPSITDYSKPGRWGDCSSPVGGHTLNEMVRSFYLTYMGGASETVAEAGAVISCLEDKDDKGVRRLSPYGEVCKEFHSFVRAHPNRGIPYIPVALVLDYYHGSYSGLETRKAFDYFDYTRGDDMTWDVVNTIWPGGWTGGDYAFYNNATTGLVNSPYGEYVDVLLQNAPEALLCTYPCVLLSGDMKLSEEEAEKFVRYTEQGGRLLLNRAYLPQFPAFAAMDGPEDVCRAAYGQGTVILYGWDYDLTGLDEALRQVLRELLPVQVVGDVDQMINVQDEGLLVTLMNHSGVYKVFGEADKIDTGEVHPVTLRYKGAETLRRAKDLVSGRVYTAQDNTVRLALGSGQTTVLELQF